MLRQERSANEGMMRMSGERRARNLGDIGVRTAMMSNCQNAQPAKSSIEAETLQTVQRDASRLFRIVAEACRQHPENEDLIFTGYLLDMLVRSTIKSRAHRSS
jgi:hypothetical protein